MYILEKTKNFITGISHPGQKLEMIKEAGINWVRVDVPYPFKSGGSGELDDAYGDFKERCKKFAEYGLRAMCLTPYPFMFIGAGIDPTTDEGLEQVRQICRFLAADLAFLEVGWQITNEMYVTNFRAPLTFEQAVPFIIAGLKGIREGAPEAISGHNSMTFDGWGNDDMLLEALRPYQDLMDYIGLDNYRGTLCDGETDDILAVVERAYKTTGLPVLVQEFGFASEGTIYTKQDVADYIKSMGYDKIEDIHADPTRFVKRMPHSLAEFVMRCPENERGGNAVAFMPHLLKKFPGGSKIYRHTPEGQAAFYSDLIGKMMANEHTCGMIIYSWSDAELCFYCYCDECPNETHWGITYCDESPKPAYHVIKNYFAKKILK